MKSIRESVGKSGKNRPDDVFVVQTLLNRHRNPPLKLIAVDKNNGPETIRAILLFQTQVVKLNKPDGRVDPNGKTYVLLNTDRDQSWLPSAFSLAIEQLKKNITVNIQALLNTQPKKIAWGAKVAIDFKKKLLR